MIIRALDSNHDFEFGKGKQSYRTGQDALIENIDTRILSFRNDCFFDKEAGIDWIRLLGVPDTQAELVLSCRGVILQSNGVVSLESLSVGVSDRRATLQFTVNTIFTNRFNARVEVF